MQTIYTDGSCLKNPGGAGGWAAIILENETEKHRLIGGNPSTTNNKMELQAVIEALKAVENKKDDLIIYSDSKYVINGFVEKWVKGWKRNGWRTSNRTPVKNKEQWVELDRLVNKISDNSFIEWKWVRGHNGNKYNELVDQLAVKSAIQHKNKKPTSKEKTQHIETNWSDETMNLLAREAGKKNISVDKLVHNIIEDYVNSLAE